MGTVQEPISGGEENFKTPLFFLLLGLAIPEFIFGANPNLLAVSLTFLRLLTSHRVTVQIMAFFFFSICLL